MMRLVNYVSRIGQKNRRLGSRAFASSTNVPSNSPTAFPGWRLGRVMLLAGCGTYAWYMYKNYRDACEQYSKTRVDPYKLAIYRLIPVNYVTLVAGKLSKLTIPYYLRAPIYRTYGALFGAKLEESAMQLETFSTFNEFFTRALRDDIRPIDSTALIVAPTDGKILSTGQLVFNRNDVSIESTFPEQIKGITYPLSRLLGDGIVKEIVEGACRKDAAIYYATMYLAPGGYHRFHAPAKFSLSTVAKIPGEVLSVAPWMFKLVPGLPCINERAVLFGKWKYGGFAVVPVGATSVRSINIASSLVSQVERRGNAVVNRGDLLGMFEMGSAIVLIFCGPKNLEWTCKPGDKVLFGQALVRQAESLPGASYFGLGWIRGMIGSWAGWV